MNNVQRKLKHKQRTLHKCSDERSVRAAERLPKVAKESKRAQNCTAPPRATLQNPTTTGGVKREMELKSATSDLRGGGGI